jgi:hypothetical protein
MNPGPYFSLHLLVYCTGIKVQSWNWNAESQTTYNFKITLISAWYIWNYLVSLLTRGYQVYLNLSSVSQEIQESYLELDLPNEQADNRFRCTLYKKYTKVIWRVHDRLLYPNSRKPSHGHLWLVRVPVSNMFDQMTFKANSFSFHCFLN